MTVELQDKLYTSTQVADILGVSLRTLYRYMEDGRIGSMRTASGRHRFTKQNIVEFLNAGGFGERTVSQNVGQSQNVPSYGYQNRNVSDQFRPQDAFRVDRPFRDEQSQYVDRRNTNVDIPFGRYPSNENNFVKPKGQDEQRYDSGPVISRYGEERVDDVFSQRGPVASDQGSSFFDNARRTVSPFDSSVSSNVPGSSFAPERKPYLEDEKVDDFGYDSIRGKNPTIEKSIPAMEIDQKPVGYGDLDTFKKDESEGYKEKFSYQPFMSQPEKTENKYDFSKSDDRDWNFSRSQSQAQVDVVQNRVPETTSFADKRPFQQTQETVDLSYAINIRYYRSEYTDLIELAKKVKDISKNRDLEYAFTLFAGLSLHFLIKPFTLLHFYANPEDMQIWKDDLKLMPSNKKEDANIGIIVNTDIVFIPSKEISGFRVVEDKVLMRDLTDVKEDELIRQFKQHLST